MQPRVLFVSKPISPPFHDGTKCLVRDVARHLTRVTPTVMTSGGASGVHDELPASVQRAEVYTSSGAFRPQLADNLRAAGYVLFRSRDEIWHFVFAPNPRTSSAGRWLKRLRGTTVVQTVASPPRSFAGVGKLLFGDCVVTQSRWTRSSIEEACRAEGVAPPRLEVIPPPVPLLASRQPAAVQALLREHGLDAAAPLFVYPGDLETSSGAETVAKIAEELAGVMPEAQVVYAYRNKTERAPAVAAELERRLAGKRVRLISEVPDVLVLISAATAVLFPVDDLWGKVDLPIVLLESMSLGVPVLALDRGPLADLQGALKQESLEPSAWVASALELVREPEARRRAIAAGQAAVDSRYLSPRVSAAYEQLYLELAPSKVAKSAER